MDKIVVRQWSSPAGEMMLGSYGERICLCDWLQSGRRQQTDLRLCRLLRAEYSEDSSPVLDLLESRLQEYFEGVRRDFDVPIIFAGTEFQRSVWQELMKIPYGTTVTYGGMARRIGRPKAVRAVASAVGSNPISIIVPCHRVIGFDGRLTGYAGGLQAKQTLLTLENVLLI